MSSENSHQPLPKRMRSVDGGGADALTTGTGPNETALGDEKLGPDSVESERPEHGNEEPLDMHGGAWGQMPANLQEFQDGDIKMEMKEELLLSNEAVEEAHEVTTDEDESDIQDESGRSPPSRSSSRASATSSSSSGVSSRPASPENVPRNPLTVNQERGPYCAKCRNHAKKIPRKGHKGFCEYVSCDCHLCKHTDDYNQVQREHRQAIEEREKARKKLDREQRLEAFFKKDQGVNRNDDSGIGGEDEKVEDDEDEDEVVHKENNED